jgi:MtN3 and saliva related transmembrane protein
MSFINILKRLCLLYKMKTIYGWIASIITLIYKLPQIYKLYKRKTSKDISVLSLVIQSTGYIFYIIHSININDNPIMLMGSGALFQTLILILLWFFYKEKKILNDISNNNITME